MKGELTMIGKPLHLLHVIFFILINLVTGHWNTDREKLSISLTMLARRNSQNSRKMISALNCYSNLMPAHLIGGI